MCSAGADPDSDSDPDPDSDSPAVRSDDQSVRVQCGGRRDMRGFSVGDVGFGVGDDYPDEIRVLQHGYCDGKSDVRLDVDLFDDSHGCGSGIDGSVGNGGSI